MKPGNRIILTVAAVLLGVSCIAALGVADERVQAIGLTLANLMALNLMVWGYRSGALNPEHAFELFAGGLPAFLFIIIGHILLLVLPAAAWVDLFSSEGEIDPIMEFAVYTVQVIVVTWTSCVGHFLLRPLLPPPRAEG